MSQALKVSITEGPCSSVFLVCIWRRRLASPTVMHIEISGFDNSSGLWAPGDGGGGVARADMLPEKKLVEDMRVGWGQGPPLPIIPWPQYDNVEGPQTSRLLWDRRDK